MFRQTLSDGVKHLLLRRQLFQGIISPKDLGPFGRRLEDVTAKQPSAHRGQCFVQESKETVLGLGILEVLNQL